MVEDGRGSTGRTLAALALALLFQGAPAQGQLWNWKSLNRINSHLAGKVVDHTHNHGCDHREYSPILGQARDLYVYLPPGYDAGKAYPVVLYLHFGYVDEHAFLGLPFLRQLDRMIARGEFPPTIVACPDGNIDGRNTSRSPHSGYMNGPYGRFEDHLLTEVIPFLTRTYSIRPEREAHGLLGASSGGFAALSLAIRHRDYFGEVAALAAPANARYYTCHDEYHVDFDPATYRWRTFYEPDETIGTFTFGLRKVPASKYIQPVFGTEPGVLDRIIAVNPTDLLFTSGLRPNELGIYVSYPARDNWNFDAQVESFAWFASRQGIPVTVDRVPLVGHTYLYFATQHRPALEWLGPRLLPPTARALQAPGG